MKKVLEWGAVILVFYVLWRWVAAFIEQIGSGGNTVQSSNYYAPGYPYQPYGGVWGYVPSVYSPGSWQGSWNGRPSGRPVRGYPGGSQRW